LTDRLIGWSHSTRLREILNLDATTQVEYKHFSSSLMDGSTFRNAKAYVYAASSADQYGQQPPQQ
jgi:hypothetical protein